VIARFLRHRTDLELSLLLVGVVVLLALGGLASDANWPKLLRVATAFLGYATVLLTTARRGESPALPAFVLAGAAAGLLSGVVRPEPMPLVFVVVMTLASAALLGPVHWLALRHHRRVGADRLRRE
jgi:hypothetical protein